MSDEALDTVFVIVITLMVRCTLCQLGDLGIDETYTIVQSRHLAWSYFDHPPLQYWITHLAVGLFGENRLARLPFILLFSATTWLMFRLTLRLYGRKPAFWAVAGLNLTAFFTISAGSWIVPDGPLLFGLVLAAAAVAASLFPAPGETATPWRSWLLAGGGFGIAALSKYHAILVAIGLLMLLATTAHRRHLRHPAPWIGGLLALAMALPVLVWNVRHGWASIAFQLGRDVPSGFTPTHLLASAAGQIALLTPWVGVTIVLALARAARTDAHRPADRFCIALAAPTIGLFGVASLLGHVTMPHWSMPGWFFLMPRTGHYFAAVVARWRRAAWTATALAGVSTCLLSLVGIQVSTGLFSALLPSAIRDQDPTLEAFSWDDLREAAHRAGLTPPADGMILTDGWGDAGKLDLAFKGSIPVMPAGPDPRGFAFTIRQPALLGHDAVVMVPKGKIEAAHKLIDAHFARIEPDHVIALWRGLGPEVDFVFYRASSLLLPFAWTYGAAR